MIYDKEQIEMQGRMKIALDILESCEEFVSIIPEVRTNLVYTREKPRDRSDVLAVTGRITAVGGRPYASGKASFGASSHMARFLIAVHEKFPQVRAGINFANDKDLVPFLESYAKKKGWILCAIDRSHEPQEIVDIEGMSVPWKAKEVLRICGDRLPKLAYENGAVGKEPVTALLGEDPIEVVEQVCELAREYAKQRNPVAEVKVGKLTPEALERLILPHVGMINSSVIVPPKAGVDSGVIDIGNGNVLVIAEDPIFTLPGLPLSFFGWATVQIGASDVAVMGVKPQFMTYTLLLPPTAGDRDVTEIVSSVDKAAKELGISIVGGHTAYYPGITSPLVGGVTVFSIAKKEELITPMGAKPGDDVILTKGPGIEAVGALAILMREKLRPAIGNELLAKAEALAYRMTVVEDAEIARGKGGVTSMHDATEGGVMGGLFEVAKASDVGMRLDERLMVYPPEVRAVCEHLGIDPLKVISEGSLIITCKPDSSEKILTGLRERSIDASVIGKVTGRKEERLITRMDGTDENLAVPAVDEFWPMFFKALQG
ncbi:MAG TPA: thiamine-phosphate synthase family protein [Methanomassiliicoccales archaeon]|jgi:hydrogenase maturation factor/predicted fused transcriptional regulator/phosphomethylpyrimidine kinase